MRPRAFLQSGFDLIADLKKLKEHQVSNIFVGSLKKTSIFFSIMTLLVLIMSLSVLDHLQSKSVSLRIEKASMHLPEVALSLYLMLSNLGPSELFQLFRLQIDLEMAVIRPEITMSPLFVS